MPRHPNALTTYRPHHLTLLQTPEGGWGLDGTLKAHNWKLRGIVNGIDAEWSPAVDVHLQV